MIQYLDIRYADKNKAKKIATRVSGSGEAFLRFDWNLKMWYITAKNQSEMDRMIRELGSYAKPVNVLPLTIKA